MRKFYSVLHYAVCSTDPLKERLTGVVSGVCHLERDSFPDDESWAQFERFLKATTMCPSKGKEGTIEATTSQMTDGEAATWLQEAFAIYTNIAEAYGRKKP